MRKQRASPTNGEPPSLFDLIKQGLAVPTKRRWSYAGGSKVVTTIQDSFAIIGLER